LAIEIGNRGTALNATGTTNVHTVGLITAANFELPSARKVWIAGTTRYRELPIWVERD
jgi:hypothetical protein